MSANNPTQEDADERANKTQANAPQEDQKAVMHDLLKGNIDKTQDDVSDLKTVEELVAETPQLSERNMPAIMGRTPSSPSIPSEKMVKTENKDLKGLNEAWEELEKEEWYHGMIPVEDAQSILHQNGDFLVRKTERERKFSPPVLTVFWDTILYHFPLYGIERSGGVMQFTVNTFHHDSSYSKVIKFHLSEKLPIFGEIILKSGAPKQTWELERTNVSTEKKIGEGEYGEVWKGKLKTKEGESVDVAIKLMKVNSSTQNQIQMFHQEARLMRVYNHRNLVKLHGMVFSDSDVMVVMELVSGGGLDSFLKTRTLLPLVKTSFCYDIAAGLAYLHSNNCMHRDVAARNCLVTSDNRMVKLSDFGLASHGRRAKLTQFDKVPIRWQAPEVLLYHIYVRESDVWSYGMLMSEIYNDGKVPFHGKSIAEVRKKIHDPEFRPFVPQLDNYPEIPIIMKKCWATTVMKRPKMRNIAKVLQKYCIHTIKDDLETPVAPKQKFIHRRQHRSAEKTASGTQVLSLSGKEARGANSRMIVNATNVEHIVQGQRLVPFIPSTRRSSSRSVHGRSVRSSQTNERTGAATHSRTSKRGKKVSK